MHKIALADLPDKKSPKYLEVLTENVITAYKEFLSDSMAMDYCKVPSKTRGLVVDNPEYKISTRQIRAEKYLEELDEIEELSKRFKDEVDRENYDMRDKKEAAAFEADQKTWLAGKLKVAEMRRDLLRMTKDEDRNEEADALNIFFVQMTREEFEQMKNHEIMEGNENAKEALAADESKEGPQAAREIFAERTAEEAEMNGGYIVHADGSVEDRD